MTRQGFLVFGILLLCLFMGGCATNQNSDFIPYTSPIKYANDDCATLREKAEIIDAEIRNIYPSAGPRVGLNAAVVGVGLFVFWPAFLLYQDTDKANSLALTQLKGDVDAISNVATHKKCDFLQQR